VTSGAGGYYRPGVAVAVIAKLTPDGGIGQLVAEPGATNYVAIEPITEAAALEALDAADRAGPGAVPALPPKPKPKAAPAPSSSASPTAATAAPTAASPEA
jgi:rod shape-determining protein MreC